jgi:hypothetical protein
MRRIRWTLAATALGCMATAAPAAANGEIKDACGPGAVGGPMAYIVEPAGTYLDLCDSDVAGFAGAGSLRGVRATLKLASDATTRPPATTRYSFFFSTKRCSVSVVLNDLATGPATRVGGYCDNVTEPCPVIEGCWMTTSGAEYSVNLPASAGRISGSTVTLSFDPNTLPSSVPASLREDLAGGVVHDVAAISWVQAGADNDTSAGEIADIAEGAESVSLG